MCDNKNARLQRMVKIYGLHDTPVDLNKGNRPSSLHTNRLSTSVHSSKNLVHSTGILTIGSKFILVFETIFFRNKKNVTCLKTSTKERNKSKVTHANTNPVWPTHHACAQPFNPFTGLVGVSVCHLAFIVVNEREVIPQSPRSTSILYFLCVFVCRLEFCKVSWDMITEQSR